MFIFLVVIVVYGFLAKLGNQTINLSALKCIGLTKAYKAYVDVLRPILYTHWHNIIIRLMKR